MTIENTTQSIVCDKCAGVAETIARCHVYASPAAISSEIVKEMGEINDNCPSETTCLPLTRQVEILREFQIEAERENLTRQAVN